jgi:hypothetical protein
MHTFKGPIKIIAKEMNITFYINLIVSIALAVLYVSLSYIINDNNMLGLLFVPFYITLFLFPFIVFKSYQYILSLGGTRVQFMVSILVMMMIYLVSSALILNIFYFISRELLQSGFIFHMADLINTTNPMIYLWVDLLWMFLLFSIGLLIQVVYFNFGTFKTFTIGGGILLILAAAFLIFDYTPFIDFIFNNYLLFLNLTGIVSVVMIISSYFMMRNAPLERGDRKVLGKHVVN